MCRKSNIHEGSTQWLQFRFLDNITKVYMHVAAKYDFNNLQLIIIDLDLDVLYFHWKEAQK